MVNKFFYNEFFKDPMQNKKSFIAEFDIESTNQKIERF
jgi:hypothetical protein